MEKILSVENLHVSFYSDGGEIAAVRGVSFDVNKGETLAIVGESGSGKSVTAKTLMKLLPKQNSIIKQGDVKYGGKNLVQLTNRDMEKLRGSEISMVFQDPMTSLNPTMTIGKQVMEGLKRHRTMSKKTAYTRTVELLELVGIPDPGERINQYPHQFSGGMRQRVVIAMALACNPKMLIADEPTTALDVTIQAQILELMKELQKKFQTAIILITHDLGVVANMAQRVAVMYAGEIMESGTLDEIFYQPKHPYTWGLLSSMPKLHADRSLPLTPIPGTPPDLSHLPEGCPFAPRCQYALKVCHQYEPGKTKVSTTHTVSCWLEDERAPKVKKPEGIGGMQRGRQSKIAGS
ncbi:oligopeptide transport system ATP-binding protein [Evansella caseinilytica]|uniref:Oligopeptide transport system ATP-binding protein n=1 Tax=Evansella caseinilytica TaxID=1503961 RepID=A0A1H3UH45_9BACI|nr:ABC transporter ATP-binding protein [Evansella caseinilytica]SDZ61728.1 oligopeptide transport system ATP-binding protein [Evansella caseinilytica]